MSVKPKIAHADTEPRAWAEADDSQKSYVVQILHWFHYRPNRLKSSWKQEEVLTWELIRALEVLPHGLFLQPLLRRLQEVEPGTAGAVSAVLDAEAQEVTAYPTLGMSGGKKNCKSDIGIGSEGVPTIWLEAKTASFKPAELDAQLRQQATAMASLMPGRAVALVTLLPRKHALPDFPNLDWSDVEAALVHCGAELRGSIPDADLSRGYRLIVRELLGRIQTHPNRKSGWV